MENRPKRKPNRLAGYNYDTDGGYFITICTKNRQCILSGSNGLSPLGFLAEQQLLDMAEFYETITVEKFVIMPDHLHLILFLQGVDPMTQKKLIAQFIATFKRFTNKKAGQNLWQRSFHDHVIRGEHDYLRIWKYIDENPVKRFDDKYFFEK